MGYYFEVQTRRVESGARGDDDVGDAAPLIRRERKPVKRTVRQPRSKALEQLHAARGGGKSSGDVNLFFVAPRAIGGGRGIDKRVAALDCRQARHAAKKVAGRAFLEQAGRKIDEGPMNIVLRDCGGDAIDVRGRQ